VNLERTVDARVPVVEVAVPDALGNVTLPSACLAPLVHAALESCRRFAAGGVIGIEAHASADARVDLRVRFPCDLQHDGDFERALAGARDALLPGETLSSTPAAGTMTVVYSGPLQSIEAAVAEPLYVAIEEREAADAAPLPLALRIAATALVVPLLCGSFYAIHGIGELFYGRTFEMSSASQALSVLAFSWPLTAAVLLCGSRLSVTADHWKFATAMATLIAALAPVVWARTSEQRLTGHLTFDSLVFLTVAMGAIAYRTRLQWHRKQLETAEVGARFLQMQALQLRLQLNPHFLLNALNSVAALLRDPPAARRMAARLGDFVRHVLNTTDHDVVPLRDELRIASAYVDIENVRFGMRLALEIDVDDALLDIPVPTLMLQPLVENSVRHGLREKGGGVIAIRARAEENKLCLVVRDHGDAAPDRALVEGIGLKNTRLRLQHLYGDDYVFEARQCDGGFEARVTIPCARTTPAR
jgi:hypothetical protein